MIRETPPPPHTLGCIRISVSNELFDCFGSASTPPSPTPLLPRHAPCRCPSTFPSSPRKDVATVSGRTLTEKLEKISWQNKQLLDPDFLSIAVKRIPRPFHELVNLLHNTATITKDFVMKIETKDENKKSFQEGYERGLKAASLIFESDPEISSLIKTALTRRDPNKPRPESKGHYPPFDIPPYTEVIRFMSDLKDNRERTLGRIDGKDIHMAVMGYVPTTFEDDIDFSDKCIIRIGNEYEMDAYCLGVIEYTGTGILISEDDRVFAYSVPLSINPPWQCMGETIGAEVFISASGEITLQPIPNLNVESLDGF